MTDEIPLTTALPHFPDQAQLLEEIRSVLESRMLTNRGPQVLQLEKEVGHFLDNPKLSVVSCANATVGAELVLRAMNLKGKVITTPFTFVATVHAIVNAGLEPVFADIDPETYCLSPKSVEEKLAKDIVAVSPVHVYGNICDIDYFEGLRKKGIRVVYDSAHALGAKHKGKAVGAFGDAEVFSLHATKIVNACEGGLIVTHDQDLAKKISLMTNFGFSGETSIELVGTNAKMSEIHAVFGLHSFRRLADSIAARRKVENRYRALLPGISDIKIMAKQKHVDSNAQYLPVFLPNETLRDKLYDGLKAQQIFARKYFFPLVPHFAPYRDRYRDRFPVAEAAAKTVLCLPIHTLMQEAHVDKICENISRILKQ